jgi:putative hemolysin
VEFLDASMSIGEAARIVSEAPHSRYPVIRDSADDVIGFVHVRDLLTLDDTQRDRRLGAIARKVPFFPGSKAVIPALTEMRRRGQHLAIVVDEYGGTAGIVTLEDLVEELVGDIRDEYDEPTTAVASEVDGLLNLEDFADRTGVELPEGPYETVAGFVVARLGVLPAVGTSVDTEGCRLTVSAMDGRRIARIRVTPLTPPEPASTAADALPE